MNQVKGFIPPQPNLPNIKQLTTFAQSSNCRFHLSLRLFIIRRFANDLLVQLEKTHDHSSYHNTPLASFQ